MISTKNIYSLLRLLLKSLVCVSFNLLNLLAFSQISPGDLSEAHSHLEGISNCTQCHILGEKVSNDKCLDCHKFIKTRIDENKGYHSSVEIKGKDCVECHSDHYGRNFELVRFDNDRFNHDLTGYKLEGAHLKKECSDCHKKKFIVNNEIKNKKKTYLGLDTKCLSCHDDYHQKTLSNNCLSCHNYTAFKPASGFNHNNAKFKLVGKHKEIDCKKCHKISVNNNVKFQQFTGLEFQSCTNCHEDVHNNKFGQNCTKCHNEQSFTVVASLNSFDHDRTNFKLTDKHLYVDCIKCHKNKLTDPVKHANCFDCHTDYHRGEFYDKDRKLDCDDCHTTAGFSGSLYTIEMHNKTEFKLEGAHLATPCFVCHKKKERWEFGNMGTKCFQCHTNIHKGYISEKYYPDQSCYECHNVNSWSEITFNHDITKYILKGKHVEVSCRDCHFKPANNSEFHQQFNNLDEKCVNCHKDVHYSQFQIDGSTDCLRCHEFNNWKPEKFDHNSTRFPLSGKHINVECKKCHKNKFDGTDAYVLYKLNEFKCENCH